MIVVSRNFKKEELEQGDNVLARMYQKIVIDSKNERLTESETYVNMKDHPFIKDVIISVLKGSKVLPDNRYWMSSTLQISNVLTQNKSLSYLDKKANPAMFVWGFRFCKDDAEFWVGSNVDEQQLMDENKSFKDILMVQGIELFTEGQDDGVITHTFTTSGIQWDESWVEHRYRNDNEWVLDTLMKHADKLIPEFIYGDYGDIDIPFNEHKHCIKGEEKILYTVLNCLREQVKDMEALQDLLLDIHRSYLERIERQQRFMEYIRSQGLEK